MRVVIVMFEKNNTDYHYFVPEGDDPQIGDWVLTSHNWDAENDREFTANLPYGRILYAAKIGKIIGLCDGPTAKSKRFYMVLIPREKLIATRKRNMELVSVIKRREKAKARLDVLVKEQRQRDAYEQLAAKNSEAAELIREIYGDTKIAAQKDEPSSSASHNVAAPIQERPTGRTIRGTVEAAPTSHRTTSSGESNNCEQDEGA